MRTESAPTTETPPYPRKTVQDVFDSGECLLVVLGHEDDAELSLVRLGAVSAAVVPIDHADERFGVLAVMATRLLQESELRAISAVSSLVANGFVNARHMKRLRAVERRLRDENRFLRAQQPLHATFQEIINDTANEDAIRAYAGGDGYRRYGPYYR